ncbi:hypothetical protein QUF80_15390 [Desulfococcaceae bacterium HSG8]|nr:hypothetical protein [Desulfococcaceae bacterium HSG8]
MTFLHAKGIFHFVPLTWTANPYPSLFARLAAAKGYCPIRNRAERLLLLAGDWQIPACAGFGFANPNRAERLLMLAGDWQIPACAGFGFANPNRAERLLMLAGDWQIPACAGFGFANPNRAERPLLLSEISTHK